MSKDPVSVIEIFLSEQFPAFGVNKKRELTRLLFEIMRREGISLAGIAACFPEGPLTYARIKDYLLKRRYPSLTSQERTRIPPLTEIRLQPGARVQTGEPRSLQPGRFFVEQEVWDAALVKRLRQKYSHLPFDTISSYKEYRRSRSFDVADYNQRGKTFFLIKENFHFYQECPCTPGAAGCGYRIMNTGFGCAFDCVYCFLQSYTNAPGIVLPANLEDFFERFRRNPLTGRLGTGQFTDSLVFDPLTEFSPRIIEFFRDYPQTVFEFKTKSSHVDLILHTPRADNVVVSWSLNPQRCIDQLEFHTASLAERLRAAGQCCAAGYRIGFHFDPIVYFPNWKNEYETVIEGVFQHIPMNRIAWISLGCLRMTQELRQTIEKRFPQSPVLDAEMILGYDGKLRYPERIRREIYSAMAGAIHTHTADVPVYLCMEKPEMGLNG